MGKAITGADVLKTSNGGFMSGYLPSAKLSRKEKEEFIATRLACPNCGAKRFDETCSNAAITLRCDCGLTFNFMPVLRHVEIVRDPAGSLAQ